MQNFTTVDENTSVKSSLYALIDNQKTVASDFSGTAFPTTNLILNQTCFRTDEQKLYRLTAMGPDVWTLETDLNAPQPVNAGNLPAQRPSLLMDFVNGPQRLQGKVNFSRASTATYYDATGKLVTAAADVPRFDHNPLTKICRGLLIEEQRTNLLTWSGDFSNAAWLMTEVTLGSAVLAPDGVSMAAKLVESANNTSHFAQRAAVMMVGTAYVASVFFKAAERSRVYISGSNTTGNGGGIVWFDLATGTVGASSITDSVATITDVGGGWFQCTATFPNTLVANQSLRYGLYSPSASTVTYAGDGASGAYAWGAQLEAAGTPTSYIPTTDAQVTRAADVASVAGGSWVNTGAGTMYAEAEMVADSNTQPRLWQLRATNGDMVQTSGVSATQTVKMDSYVGAVYQAAMTTNAFPLKTPFRTAFGWSADSFAGAVNGGVVLTDSAGSVPAFGATSTLWLGRDVGTSRYLNGWLRGLRYYPTRLSNNELQALTT